MASDLCCHIEIVLYPDLGTEISTPNTTVFSTHHITNSPYDHEYFIWHLETRTNPTRTRRQRSDARRQEPRIRSLQSPTTIYNTDNAQPHNAWLSDCILLEYELPIQKSKTFRYCLSYATTICFLLVFGAISLECPWIFPDERYPY